MLQISQFLNSQKKQYLKIKIIAKQISLPTKMSKKLKFKLLSCSSQQSQFPSSSLLFAGQNGGWQTKRFCTYPQQVTFEFYGNVKVDKIQIISDSRKIPSQVDILYYLPFRENGREAEARFTKYGYLNFNKNQNSQYREQKSIMVDVKCSYLRFLFYKPHHSKENFFSQVGIQQISIYGSDTNSTFAPIQKLPRQIGENSAQNYDFDDDPFLSQKIALLNSQKQRAVQAEDFQTANQFKLIIDTVKKAGQELKKLQMSKRQAIEEQDYEKANNLKKSIQNHKRQIDALISYEDGGDDNVMEENQFAQQNNTNQPNLNDFQDNQFVDPDMNEMIKKSGTFSKVSNGQGSRINGGNSRVKINNKSIILKKQKQQIQNYEDRVIPTLAGGNKLKTEESQLLQKQDEKKVEYEPQQIDGKFIQFALILQQHFEQDTVKRFFSDHWQLKVQALTKILSQIKKKPSADASFIKCLIVVVKNSISQTNFQVSSNSLQILVDLLKLNSKGNILSRTNQVGNDLDTILREVIKKMTDNNNKIKVESQKLLTQMVNSSLYGPQACTLAMTKTKQKVKLSSKQILSRIVQLEKIVEKHSNSQPILAMASDYGIQNAKNPAIQVRNQSFNLLLLCKMKDTSGQIEKKLSQKDNILAQLEAFENKSAPKAIDKPVKKKK